MSLINRVRDLATNDEHTRWMIPLLLVVDAALCGVVIEKIPYTEIDWTTYMQHIALIIKGERDYTKITGSTGPLVYPGAHVWIYKQLFKITDEGRDIQRAQYIFALVYLGTLALVFQCYRKARVPPYVFPLLILSKRLHSIFLLRCFNDCFAVLGLFAALFCYQRDQWHIGSFLFATGLNVKMSLLLPLPAMGVLMIMKLGSREAMTHAMIIFQTTVLFGYPFRKAAFSYFGRAFELSRQFTYKWTVNWRFVSEETFLSKPFALGLLSVHVTLLITFFLTRWIKPSKRTPKQFLKIIMPQAEPRDQDTMALRITPNFTMTVLLTAMTIGMLCARSLHYQFYAYIAWATPFLLWKAGFHPVLQYALWAAQEWAWNVYPSTSVSSGVVVAVLAVTVGGVWWGTRDEYVGELKGVVGHDHED
ncbi:hypothetical protein HBI62_241970 [Parastagonospora nodorum]|nr:hypothetical protein HBH82_242070 [Parastagonospora nodorum]KAH4658807.1 hypothetical protein HBH78_236550 [Parastagonospora nodorum]KAH4691499.1 hypothetical protein HBH67_243980 [Parastagonospora nodorum]KAH4751654.1 hypothetical protein HBH63_241460 [Parastagonospora nodorum]KAH4768073.1 hypothetical protein HBH62_239870 [Parastagonospora nodorum]